MASYANIGEAIKMRVSGARTPIVAISLYLVASTSGLGQSAAIAPLKSMMWSCKNELFLQVSVSTKRRDIIPLTEFRITNERSQAQGVDVNAAKIPQSQYAVVFELPSDPDHSRVRAVEVCGADEGQYTVTFYEHGTGEYRISVRARANSSLNSALSDYLDAKEGRIRRTKFAFKVKGDDVDLTWLSESGRPQVWMDTEPR